MTPDTASTSRPNILLIHSDQHRWDCLGCHGHPLLRTPNLDRLAEQGVDFQQAYTPAPVCTPARASLLTGQWPTQHGSQGIPGTEIYRPVSDDLPLYWHHLAEAGYRQAHVGKWHGESPHAPDHYIDDYVPEEDYATWRASQGIPPQERRNEWFGEIDPHIAPEQHRIAWGARHAAALMERYVAEDRPWMVRWDPSEPHLPNLIPPALADLYPPQQIEPWPSFGDTLENKPFIQAQQRRSWGLTEWTWERDWAPMVSRYLAEITLLDEHVGRLLAKLDELGQSRDTLVIYTTDHGDFCGGHGMIDKHFSMYDDVLRVPLILRFPGRLPAGRTSDAFVAHEIDLGSTICKIATGSIPESFQGVDLIDVGSGRSDGGRQDIYAQYQGSQFGLYSERMLRDRRWKYVWNATAEDELYDTQADPGELVNRAQDPACRDQLMRLRARLVAWMEQVGDPLLNAFTRPQFEQVGVKG